MRLLFLFDLMVKFRVKITPSLIVHFRAKAVKYVSKRVIISRMTTPIQAFPWLLHERGQLAKTAKSKPEAVVSESHRDSIITNCILTISRQCDRCHIIPIACKADTERGSKILQSATLLVSVTCWLDVTLYPALLVP